jgi:hypothetical protein
MGSTICPSVNALVPQVYLPEGYAQGLRRCSLTGRKL